MADEQVCKYHVDCGDNTSLTLMIGEGFRSSREKTQNTDYSDIVSCRFIAIATLTGRRCYAAPQPWMLTQ